MHHVETVMTKQSYETERPFHVVEYNRPGHFDPAWNHYHSCNWGSPYLGGRGYGGRRYKQRYYCWSYSYKGSLWYRLGLVVKTAGFMTLLFLQLLMLVYALGII